MDQETLAPIPEDTASKSGAGLTIFLTVVGLAFGFFGTFAARSGILQLASISDWWQLATGPTDALGQALIGGIRQTIWTWTLGGGVAGLVLGILVSSMRKR
jgi:hypothetical protein